MISIVTLDPSPVLSADMDEVAGMTNGVLSLRPSMTESFIRENILTRSSKTRGSTMTLSVFDDIAIRMHRPRHIRVQFQAPDNLHIGFDADTFSKIIL
jgi:hypothetical protein